MIFFLFLGCQPADKPSIHETGGETTDSPADSQQDDEDSDTSTDTDTATTTDSVPDTDTIPPPPLAGPRGLLVAQRWDDAALPTGAGAGQYRVIYLQESMYTLIPDIRAANPDALLFAYQKVGGMREDGHDHPSTGVQVDEADESWFLHDANGNRLEFCDYAGVWAADIGNVDYQARWLDNVRTRMLADGFDGVMMDDTNTFPGHCMGSKGTPLAEYADDEAYGDAAVAFLAAVGPELQKDGLMVAPNIGMNPWEPTMVAQATAMLPSITHWVREYWMRWDDSENFVDNEWEATLETMTLAEQSGVGYLATTYGPGAEGPAEGKWYGRASWLLAWDGVRDSAWGYWGDGEDPYSDEWGPDLGFPTEAAAETNGIWIRRYALGIVVVNPTSTDGLMVNLGATYVDPVLGAVDQLTLDHGTGRVLAIKP